MRCPKCVQQIHRSAHRCPHCGFGLSDLDDVYGAKGGLIPKLNDAAGVLRMRDRRRVSAWLSRFEKHFPQLFLSVYCCALDDGSNIRELGLWTLNHSTFKDVDDSRSQKGGVLLVIDVSSKVASISYGYALDSILNEENTFEVLAKAHPYLLEGDYVKALHLIIKRLTVLLRKKASVTRHSKTKAEHHSTGAALGSPSSQSVSREYSEGGER